MKRISKEIEIAKFKTKLLSQEKDKKTARLRHLKQKHNALVDENEERSKSVELSVRLDYTECFFRFEAHGKLPQVE